MPLTLFDRYRLASIARELAHTPPEFAERRVNLLANRTKILLAAHKRARNA